MEPRAEFEGFPGGSVVKNPPTNAGDSGDRASIPGLRRFPGEGNGNPLQYSCLENPIDGGAWWATVHGVAKSQTQLSNSLSLFFSDSVVQNPLAKAGDMGLILGLGRSPGEGNGNPLQYSCLGNPRDRGAWQATVHEVVKSRT